MSSSREETENENNQIDLAITSKDSEFVSLKSVQSKQNSFDASFLSTKIKSEKFDELTSLEREIAEMHHVEPRRSSVSQTSLKSDGNISVSNEIKSNSELVEMQSQLDSPTPSSIVSVKQKTETSSEDVQENVMETLEEEDLIAVLKGVGENEHNNENADEDKQVVHMKQEQVEEMESSATALGVTIEGEGEFQIMEIDDDCEENEEAGTVQTICPSPPASSAPGNKENKTTLSTKQKVFTKKIQKPTKELSKEEERNLAMEQIQGLKSSRNKEQNKNRRKQDIKAMTTDTDDLVSVLGADWSDEDARIDLHEQPETKRSEGFQNGKAFIKKDASSPESEKILTGSSNEKPPNNKTKRQNSPPNITSVFLLKSGSTNINDGGEKSESTIENKDKVTENNNGPTVTNQPQTTGFKRTRIIKRKIIWDPDAPETTFSYAQLIKPSSVSQSIPKTKKESISVASSAQKAMGKSPTLALPKKEQVQKKARPITPKDKKLAGEKEASTSASTETKIQRSATPKLPMKKEVTVLISKVHASAITPKQITTTDHPKSAVERNVISPVKRRSQTPVSNGAAKKKKITEVDRLMGDEGAINMLNSLENERQKAAENSDSFKPNMRSRAATISEKFAYKKETSPVKKDTTGALAKTKRVQKPKASASWDYVYKQQATEDAMIIRRRSNSSYSSSASAHRLSLDTNPLNSTKTSKKATTKVNTASSALKLTNKQILKAQSSENLSAIAGDEITTETVAGTLKASPKSSSSPTGKTFEFAKPEIKSNPKARKNKISQAANPLESDMKKANAASASNKRLVRSPATVEDKEKISAKSPVGSGKEGDATFSSCVKRFGKIAQIIFSTSKAKIDFTFNVELLNYLVNALQKLKSDADCNVVVVTTNAPNFCQGVDFTELATGPLEKRKKAANSLATAVKNFLMTLATFPKPIIAGVNGNNIGLGVTMLPLFDIVIASDKGTYETPYAKIGQVPEGYCIWNSLTKIRGTFKTKLFWLCEKLHSTESALSGLVNKLTASSKINEEALATAKRIAGFSAETYQSMKRTSLVANLELFSSDLDQEFQTISEQWTSEECFENFKKYMQTGHW